MLSEEDYRKLDIDSYSSISKFLEDRKKYYRKFVLKEEVEEDDVQSLRIGSLVDCLALPNENGTTDFKKKFLIAKAKIPTGQILQFCNEFYKLTKDYNDNDLIDDNIIKQAYNIVGFKRDSYENILKKLGENTDYITELRNSKNKILITQEDLNKAEKTVRDLYNSKRTGDIMSLTNSHRYIVINQLTHIFNYGDITLKAMLDKVVIDHEKKTIQPYDLKTTYSVDDFSLNYYKYKYYIQAAVYWNALRNWAKENGYIDQGYNLEYMKFIVCDSSGYMQPLVYTTNEEHYAQALGGFYMHGKYYPGLNQALSDIQWHKHTGMWNISRNNYEGKDIEITINKDML